jgi:hypothetical protein
VRRLIGGETLFCAYTTIYVDRQLSLMGFPWVMAIYYVAVCSYALCFFTHVLMIHCPNQGTRLVFNLREELGGNQVATKELELQPRHREPRSAGMVFANPDEVTMEHERMQRTMGSSRTDGMVDRDIT